MIRERLAAAYRVLRTGEAVTASAQPVIAPAGPAAPPQAPYQRWGTRGVSDSSVVRDLTPARVASYLTQANAGDTRAFAQLCEQVLDRDSHIVATLGVRQRAVANLAWHLEPASEDALDRRIAAECEREIRQMARLRAGLLGLLGAIFTGYAGAEIEWTRRESGLVRPARLLYRPSSWLRPDPDDLEAWRVIDASDPTYGVPLRANGWVLHVSQAKSGWPSEAGLGRVLIWWYLFKNYAIKDWVTYGEKFGSPFRVGKYPAGATTDDISALDEALRQLGVDASACIPSDMDIDFHADAGGKTGGDTYERFLGFANREISKVVLGNTLTIEGGPNGTQALGTVHNDVRGDIRDADALELAETLTRDLVGPFVRWNYGERAALPTVSFDIEPAPDKKADAEAQDARGRVFLAARQLGIAVPVSQVREELGIRTPEAGEPILPAIPLGGGLPARALSQAEYSCCERSNDRSGRPHLFAAAARPVGETTAVLQFDTVVRRYREALAAAWRDIVATLRAELGDSAERSLLEARITAALGQVDTGRYVDELAAATLHAEALGIVQVEAEAGATRPLPTSSPLADGEAWAAALGVTVEAWSARVVSRRATATDAVHNALLRTAAELTATLGALEGEDARKAALQAGLDAAEVAPQRTDAVLEGAATTGWGEGRWAGVTADQGRRPYLRYHTVGDDRVRVAHRAMEGRVYPANHPIWQVWRPPNGYGCRCWVTAHTLDEVRAAGWAIFEDYPVVEETGTPAAPDAGWQRHHGEADYDWAALPPAWKRALATREERV